MIGPTEMARAEPHQDHAAQEARDLLHMAVAAALDAGLAVVPPKQDGSKMPLVPWKAYQAAPPTRDQVRRWYGHDGYFGLGLVTGAVSGGLEMLAPEGRAVDGGP